MLLLSFECLPYICSETLKLLHEKLDAAYSPAIAFVAAGPCSHTPTPRPLPSPKDPYHELHALLQRLRGVHMAIQRAKYAHGRPPPITCVLDGWIPTAAVPHPAVATMCLDMTRALLPDVLAHALVYFRGTPHESFERVLDVAAQEDDVIATEAAAITLADILGTQERLDGIMHRSILPSPFPVTGVHTIDIPLYCNDNPVETVNAVTQTLRVLHQVLKQPLDAQTHHPQHGFSQRGG